MSRICWNKYHTPYTIEEAVQWLDHYDGNARMVGGGTDLLLEIQQGLSPAVEALVDTSRISGLDQIGKLCSMVIQICSNTHITTKKTFILYSWI